MVHSVFGNIPVFHPATASAHHIISKISIKIAISMNKSFTWCLFYVHKQHKLKRELLKIFKYYTLRLKGAEHLEDYSMERRLEELERLVDEKQGGLLRNKEEVRGEEEEPLRRDQAPEQPVESEETIRERERGLRLHMSRGALQEMHKDAKTRYKSPMVQLVGKNLENGRLKSMTLNDGQYLSANVEPLNDEMAEEINNFNGYDMLVIRGCEEYFFLAKKRYFFCKKK